MAGARLKIPYLSLIEWIEGGGGGGGAIFSLLEFLSSPLDQTQQNLCILMKVKSAEYITPNIPTPTIMREVCFI